MRKQSPEFMIPAIISYQQTYHHSTGYWIYVGLMFNHIWDDDHQ